jgi:hypothetical protein
MPSKGLFLIPLMNPVSQPTLTLMVVPTMVLGQAFPPHWLAVGWLTVGLRPPYVPPGQHDYLKCNPKR